MSAQNWNRIFGTALGALTEHCTDLGAFLLDKSEQRAMLDSNGIRLLGLRHQPDFDELYTIITQSASAGSENDTEIIIAEQSEDIIAGFIHLHTSHAADFNDELPVYSYTQFVSEVTQSAKDSLLALLQIEEYGNPDLKGLDMSTVLTGIIAGTPKGTILSAAEKNRFWLYIPDFSGSKTDCLEKLQKFVREYVTENSGTNHNITFSAGCGADVSLPSQRMQTAEFTLFDAAAAGLGTVRVYSDERYEQQKTEYENMRRFTRLVDGNLFRYHFQPIISSHSGEIIAYEALMRTDESIGMNPLEVLGAATKLGRLYDIEKATMRNTLEFICAHQEDFADKKLFVNSIPAHILSFADWDKLCQDYGELMQKMVIEMTEQTELDDDRIAIIHDRLRRSGIQLAIDDYGTGYSNASNLLRYMPDYVKIDRSLIEGINANPKMQKFVSGIIEFIHENGYSALAEGVETREELTTMIQLGADLIQGYYISKPRPFVLHEIPQQLRDEIVEYNLMFSENIVKVYHPEENETVNLQWLSSNHYGSLFVETEKLIIEGAKGAGFNCPVIIKDGISCELTLRNASINTDKENPVITIGTGACVTLVLEGDNEVLNRGIWVPQTASLDITGSGSLHIHAETQSCYGIGVDRDNSPGNITISCSGRLQVDANGENSVAIGGGKNLGDTVIRMLAGEIAIFSSGGNCVGIGNFDGNSRIEIVQANVSAEISATAAIAVGSLTGSTDLVMDNYILNVVESGVSLCGAGVLSEGSGSMRISNGTINQNMHGQSIICLGSDKGSLDCSITAVNISLYCEGGSVCGIGDVNGSGNVNIRRSGLDMRFLCKDGIGLAGRPELISVSDTAEKILINE